DFFPPVVDDAWTWGAVAAANAMSDVYAMGGEVMFALAVAGFPREMDKAIVAEVFRGGAEKVAEAGGVIAGGHTVVDNEPKYGLCVTGRVHPDRVLSKGGLRPGDRPFLAQALGTGGRWRRRATSGAAGSGTAVTWKGCSARAWRAGPTSPRSSSRCSWRRRRPGDCCSRCGRIGPAACARRSARRARRSRRSARC